EKKCKHILYIRPKEFSMPATLRYEGYKEVIERHSLAPHVMEFDEESELFEFDYRPYDGIFIWNDKTAIDVLFHLIKIGFSIPDELKIVGFDNNFLSGSIYPSLTTIDQPYEEMAREAVSVLIKNIESGKIDKEERVLPTKLITRETTE